MATARIKYMQRSPTAWLAPAQDSPPASRMNRRGAARTYHMYLFWGAGPQPPEPHWLGLSSTARSGRPCHQPCQTTMGRMKPDACVPVAWAAISSLHSSCSARLQA